MPTKRLSSKAAAWLKIDQGRRRFTWSYRSVRFDKGKYSIITVAASNQIAALSDMVVAKIAETQIQMPWFLLQALLLLLGMQLQ